jgi:FkbM family methyltransferase
VITLNRSALRRIWGISRSLLTYHAIPLRQRRLRALYASFVRPGDLVFDVGGHVGNHTRALVALGCRVVTIEPQPDFARLLRRMFRKTPSVCVLEVAASDTVGRTQLAISERNPTVSTIATDWRTARSREHGFARVRWDHMREVTTTTLDALIGRYGVPTFVKIDVEGAEPQVLTGLTHCVAALSFEYLLDDLMLAERCVRRLEERGPYRFNWTLGEARHLLSQRWLTGDDLISTLKTTSSRPRSGDVYAAVCTEDRESHGRLSTCPPKMPATPG